MNIKRLEKAGFAVIGMEGSTREGEGFIERLWQKANSRFGEVAHLAQKDDAGDVIGIWGVMTGLKREFEPWANGFTEGYYLAGVECAEDAEPPKGWTKWTVPAFEYVCVENEGPDTFGNMLEYMDKSGLELAGAVHDFTCPKTGKGYMFFPIRRM